MPLLPKKVKNLSAARANVAVLREFMSTYREVVTAKRSFLANEYYHESRVDMKSKIQTFVINVDFNEIPFILWYLPSTLFSFGIEFRYEQTNWDGLKCLLHYLKISCYIY